MRTFGLAAAALIGGVGYRLVVGGELTLDTGLGRRIRPLGPLTFAIAAPRETVFNVIAAPYLGRTPRTLAEEIEVLERGSDMVLAAHRTSVGWGMVATTIETVRFERPETVAFRLLRGPVPHVVERFTLHDDAGATRLDYLGELGTDFWQLGRWWGGPGGPQVGSDRVGFPRPRPRRSRTKNGNRPQGPERAMTPGVARAVSGRHRDGQRRDIGAPSDTCSAAGRSTLPRCSASCFCAVRRCLRRKRSSISWGLQAQAAGSGSREHVGVGESADRSKFLELSFGLMVPPRRGDEPALFRLGFDLRLTHVEVAIGGLVAVAIVWLATRSGPAGPDQLSRAALSEAAGEDGADASLARRSAGSDAHRRRSSGARRAQHAAAIIGPAVRAAWCYISGWPGRGGADDG